MDLRRCCCSKLHSIEGSPSQERSTLNSLTTLHRFIRSFSLCYYLLHETGPRAASFARKEEWMGFRQQGTKLVPVKCIVIVPEQEKVETDRRVPPFLLACILSQETLEEQVRGPTVLAANPFPDIWPRSRVPASPSNGSEIRRTALFIMLIVPHPNLASRFHRHTESPPVDPVRNRTQAQLPSSAVDAPKPHQSHRIQVRPLFFCRAVAALPGIVCFRKSAACDDLQQACLTTHEAGLGIPATFRLFSGAAVRLASHFQRIRCTALCP